MNDNFFMLVAYEKGDDPQSNRPLLRLKEKAFVLGRDHLELESMAEEVQAAAMLNSIAGALEQWDRQSRQAATKVSTMQNRLIFTYKVTSYT